MALPNDSLEATGVLADPKSAHVLMVDDESTTLEVMEMLLHAQGYREITCCSDPRKAFDTIAELEPDVVLLNLRMPHVSGLEILAGMREQAALAAIPVLIMTGSSDATLKRRALDLGAADFLSKPVDESELALRLRNILAARGHRDGRPSTAPSPLRPPRHASPADAADRIRTIADTFLDRLMVRLDVMDSKLGDEDFDGLGDLAHWLRGAAGTVGLDQFTEHAEELGRAARDDDASRVDATLRELRTLATRAKYGDGSSS